jgi:hypothetical protein
MKMEKCSERVMGEGQWGAFHTHQCKNKAVVERDGKWYCRIHDPEYVKEKRQKRFAEKDAQQKKKEDYFRLSSTAVKACKEINPENPMAVAEKIGVMPKLIKLIPKIVCEIESMTPRGQVTKKWLIDAKYDAHKLLSDIEEGK